jgi:hypothetical protein
VSSPWVFHAVAPEGVLLKKDANCLLAASHGRWDVAITDPWGITSGVCRDCAQLLMVLCKVHGYTYLVHKEDSSAWEEATIPRLWRSDVKDGEES